MLNVTEIKVASFDLDHLDVMWKISPVPSPRLDEDSHEIFDYTFTVLRSEKEFGPFDQIGQPVRDQYSMRDTGVSLISKYRQYFYIIRVTIRVTSETKDFGPVGSSSPAPDLIAAAIVREEDVLFREFIGRRCWLFPRRTFGPLCTCFDVTLNRRLNSNHLPCFDTGFLGGYMSPVLCYVQIDPNTKSREQTSLQEKQQSDTRGRLIAFPQVSPLDILVENENKRWRVISQTPTTRLRAVVHQELVLHEIPKGDVEYNLPLRVNTADLEPASPKNFTNSYSLKDEDVDDIVHFFHGPRGTVR